MDVLLLEDQLVILLMDDLLWKIEKDEVGRVRETITRRYLLERFASISHQ